MPLKLFKKKEKKPQPSPSNGEMIYSMTPRHGHTQDVVDENGIRQVAGCLPIDPINKRFLLISSSSNPGTWVIPKGGWEKDETQKQAAMRETWEEAGVKGVITRHIGVFAEKSKTGIKAHHWIYEMEIKEVTKNFPEQSKRQRRWFAYEEAMLAVKAHYIHDALSMSSLSPLIHEQDEGKKKKKKKKDKEVNESPAITDDDDDEDKKKKKKDKKKKEKEPIEETVSFNDDEDEKKGKKKDKKKKSSKKDDEEDEEESIQEVQVDENGVPVENIKGKKKNKTKKKNTDGDIAELSDGELPRSSATVDQPYIIITDEADQLDQQLQGVNINESGSFVKEQVFSSTSQQDTPMPHEQELPSPEQPPVHPQYPSN